jgi:hypothetical protein
VADFREWLKSYKHGLLALNIKQEGIELEVIKLLKEYKIDNYLDHVFYLQYEFHSI